MATTTPARVDEEINKCLVLLADLRAQKNSFLPTFHLPPEILANVFIHGARDYHELNVRRIFNRAPHWVNVSYVCRHWRDVALNCPALWTYHFILSHRWTEELLARSKQASLKIGIYYERWWNDSWSRLVQKVLNHPERIQELRLYYVPESALPAVLSSLYAPRSQMLDIHSWDRPSKQILMINNRDTLVPLRTLKLTACPLPWHSTFNLSGVTTLFLCDIPSPSQLNIMEFLATLSRMQALTVLHLDRALPSAPGFRTFGVSLKVSLPCLARLFVVAPLSTVVTLLSCMIIPLETPVRLEIGSEDNPSIDDYAQIPPVIVQRFSQSKDLTSSCPTIRSLSIHSHMFQSKFLFTINALEHDDHYPGPSREYPPEDCNHPLMIILRMKLSMATSIRERIAGDICCSIPSTHVQTLHIIDPPFSPDFWRKMLGHFDGLRYMRLCNGYMPANLVSLLTFNADGPVAASPPGHTFVPALEELELYFVKFISKDKPSGKAVSKNFLLDALSTRKALHFTMASCYQVC